MPRTLAPLLPSATRAADPVEKFVDAPKRRVQMVLPQESFKRMAVYCAEHDLEYSAFMTQAMEHFLDTRATTQTGSGGRAKK